VFTDLWSRQSGVGDHLVLNDMAQIEEAHVPIFAAPRHVLRPGVTVRGEPIADIVPHGGRTRWLSGAA
jgi:hypothetical protein